MAMTLQLAAAKLSGDFTEAERLYDSFLLRIDAIRATIVEARTDAGVPPHAGQETLLRLHRAVGHAQSAQNDLFRAHDAIARDGRALMGPEEIYTPSSGINRIETTLATEDAQAGRPLRIAA